MVPKEKTCLGDYFISSREKGRAKLPLLSVTLNNGIVQRSDLERRTETNISPEEHLFVKEGDIVYNMMRVWQGALGRANTDGMVSPAYIVLRPNKNVNSTYTEYLFNTKKMIYMFWAYSYGITNDRLRLYFNDFKRIPVTLPCIAEQNAIAKILSIWDQTITINEKILKCNRLQKIALTQQLLTGKYRFPEFKQKWQNTLLNDIYSFKKGKDLSKSDLVEEGTRCILYGELYTKYDEVISIVHSKTKSEAGLISRSGDILIPASTTTSGIDLANATAVLEDGILLGGDINVLRPKKYLNAPFMAHLLTHIKKHEIASKAQGITIIHLYGKDLQSINVLIPTDIDEQNKIATVLTNANRKIQALQAKITGLKQEKKALMQQLLTGKRRVKVDAVEAS